MPYHVGKKGSYGCSGYPAVKDDGTVMGCHKTRSAAAGQIYAINRSEGNIGKAMFREGDFVMGMTSEGPVMGQVEHVMTEVGTYGTPGTEYAIESTPDNPAMAVRIFEYDDGELKPTAYSIGMLSSDAVLMEDMEMTMPEDYEKVEKKAPCWDGYVMRGMKPGKGGRMVPNCVPTEKADDLWEDDDDVEYDDEDHVRKAEGYSPPAGARSAARKAIKFKEDGKATGAGTAVGWTRARQLANGESLSLSTVKRMYSYFSRHEVDKKGKDWGNQANPSNGYIMWLAWGGDAGYSWSKRIVQAEMDKALFANFGKDYTRAQSEKRSLF